MRLFLRFFKYAFLLLVVVSCKKTGSAPTPPVPPVPPVGGGDTTIVPGVDPTTANTIGFFLDDWQPKSFAAPTYAEAAMPATATTTVTIDATSIITKVPLATFGHNSVWWMGAPPSTAVTDVKNLRPNVIRFPGGNSASNYFWNALQNQPPADAPTTFVDKDGVSQPASYNYGQSDHNWEFTLSHYYELLQQTQSNGLISVNYAYARYGTATDPVAAAAHLAADWVRYDNGRTKYWEIGNEHFGDWQGGYRIDLSKNKDGQPEFINGDLYGRHIKIFIDSMKKAATDIGKTIYIGAVAYDAPAESWQTNTTKTWNSGMMTSSANKADFYAVHNYFTPYDQNSNASVIFASALTVPAQMMGFVKQELQTNGATIKPIAMDEWNMWAKDSKQQVSNTAGVFATLVLGEAIKNKYGLTARWDMLNGWSNGDDHGLFSAGDEPGISKWSPRPAFYYLYYFQKTIGDRLVASTVQGSAEVKTYASTFTSGQVSVALVNTGATAQTVEVKMKNFYAGSRCYWYTLQGGTDNGEFSRKVLVNSAGPTLEAGGPTDYASLGAASSLTTGGIKVAIPARGTVFLMVDKK